MDHRYIPADQFASRVPRNHPTAWLTDRHHEVPRPHSDRGDELSFPG